MILLGLTCGHTWTKLTLPADFASKDAEELKGADFYKCLQKVRDGYTYPLAMHYQQDDGEASDALQKAKFVLVHQDRHKPPLAEAYRDPYRIKSRGTKTYILEGRNVSKDLVEINHLKQGTRRWSTFSYF